MNLKVLLISLFATMFACASPALADTWSHNGSDVNLQANNGRITITYTSFIRPGMRGLVHQGTLLFAGHYDLNGNVSGMAYVFKKGCEPAPYAVHGGFDLGDNNLHLEGAAPIRDKYSCRVLGSTWNSSNARLDFLNVAED